MLWGVVSQTMAHARWCFSFPRSLSRSTRPTTPSWSSDVDAFMLDEVVALGCWQWNTKSSILVGGRLFINASNQAANDGDVLGGFGPDLCERWTVLYQGPGPPRPTCPQYGRGTGTGPRSDTSVADALPARGPVDGYRLPLANWVENTPMRSR